MVAQPGPILFFDSGYHIFFLISLCGYRSQVGGLPRNGFSHHGFCRCWWVGDVLTGQIGSNRVQHRGRQCCKCRTVQVRGVACRLARSQVWPFWGRLARPKMFCSKNLGPT